MAWRLGLLFWVCAGCATTTTRFTPAAELTKLRGKAHPTGVLRSDAPDVAEWDLAGPFPDSTAPTAHEQDTPWARLLFARQQALTPTGSLGCAARELARFVATTDKAPGLLLREHITARCGFTAHAAINWLSGEQGEHGDAALFEHWRADVDKLLAAQAPGQQAGIGFAHVGTRAAVMVVTGLPTGTVELTTFGVTGGKVVLRGQAPARVATLDVSINQGATLTALCRDTGREQLPRFEYECPVEPTDRSTWVSLSAREEGRLLGYEFAQVLVWPGAERALKWTHPAHVSWAVEATPPALLAAINELRTEAGLKPVTMSPAQTDENRELAPWFFEAARDGQAREEDRLALGVIAGWRVEDQVSGGAFTVSRVDRVDGAELLNALLERPWSRALVLGADAGILALGLFEEGGALGVLVSVYPKVRPTPFPGAMNDALVKLNAERARRGLDAVQWVLLPSGFEGVLSQRLATQQVTSVRALEDLLSATVDATRRPVHGWRISASSLDSLRWPSELLEHRGLQVVGFVAAVREPGDPWVEYHAFVVLLDGPGDRT